MIDLILTEILNLFCGSLDLLQENLTDPFLSQLITNIQEELFY